MDRGNLIIFIVVILLFTLCILQFIYPKASLQESPTTLGITNVSNVSVNSPTLRTRISDKLYLYTLNLTVTPLVTGQKTLINFLPHGSFNATTADIYFAQVSTTTMAANDVIAVPANLSGFPSSYAFVNQTSSIIARRGLNIQFTALSTQPHTIYFTGYALT